MAYKLSVFLLLTIAICGGIIKLSRPQVEAHAGMNHAVANGSDHNTQDPQSIEVPGTIDGSKNPELIPDSVAYAMLFKTIAGQTTAEKKRSIRSYVSQLGLGEQRCKLCPTSTENGDGDIDALINAAEEYQQRISRLDIIATKIKGRSWPNPDQKVMKQLEQLQADNDAISRDMMATLPSRLSPTAWTRLQEQINQRVKPGIKIVPGPGWGTPGMKPEQEWEVQP